MTAYELDYDEAIILQSTTAQRHGITEDEFENEELLELILTNKNLIYVVDTSVGFFSKSKIEAIKVPLSAIKVINGEVQAKQVKHDDYGRCLQIQFLHGIEYWELEKRAIPQWIAELNQILVGTQMPTKEVAAGEKKEKRKEKKVQNIEEEHGAIEKKGKKPLTFGGFAGIASSLKNVTDSATQAFSATVNQVKASVPIQKDICKEGSPIEELLVASTEQQPVGVHFCSNCGVKLGDCAKFCQECGAPVNVNNSASTPPPVPVVTPPPMPDAKPIHNEQRQQEWVGTVLKCPNCGAIISETTAVCPDCGMRITGRTAVNSVQDFKEQLMAIEASRKKSTWGFLNIYAAADPVDKQKLTLIRNYPIPNTVDDILEIMMLAIANIDIRASKNVWGNDAPEWEVLALEMPTAISNAWVAKMQQAYQKAEILFPNDPAFAGIRKIYLEKMRELKIKV